MAAILLVVKPLPGKGFRTIVGLWLRGTTGMLLTGKRWIAWGNSAVASARLLRCCSDVGWPIRAFLVKTNPGGIAGNFNHYELVI